MAFQPIFSAHNLVRDLGPKNFRAVNHVSFEINAGQILCFLGPNGAGKTTTINMCSTLLAPTSGDIQVAGVDAVAQPRAARQHIGLVLGGDRGFYSRATARDNLLFFADVLGVPRKLRKERVEDALEAVALTDRADSKVQDFSRGMKQRLHIARGLLNDPALLFLDEPTNGLDPELALEVRKLVKSLAQRGTGILLTTHYLAEAQALADNLLIINEGKTAFHGTLQDLRAHSSLAEHATLEDAYFALLGVETEQEGK